MDSVGRLNSIIEVLRRQIAENGRRMEATGKNTLGSKTQTGAGPMARPGLPELKLRLQARLRHLDPADPDKVRKSQKLFLESVLAWEFGDSLLLDRRFGDLVEEINQVLASHPDMEKQLTELLVTLPKEE
jgi:hypothetical protein